MSGKMKDRKLNDMTDIMSEYMSDRYCQLGITRRLSFSDLSVLADMIITITIWRFPEIRLPPNHPF
jgi:hypothetical protein